jgi:hypothetical protein
MYNAWEGKIFYGGQNMAWREADMIWLIENGRKDGKDEKMSSLALRCLLSLCSSRMVVRLSEGERDLMEGSGVVRGS